jgi:predicted secreted protein
MAGIAGRLLGLMINGAFVSCETACTFNFDVDMLPASAVDSGRWKQWVQGIRSWGITVNGNLLLEAVGSDVKTIIQSGFLQGMTFYLQFSTKPSATTEMVFSGAGFVKGGQISAPSVGVANWSVNFNGTGALTTRYVDYELLIDAMPAQADYPLVINSSFTT